VDQSDVTNPWTSDAYARINLRRLDAHIEGTPEEVDFVLEQTGLRPPADVLDVACGAGRHSLEFARRGFGVTGIDISPFYIDTARHRAERDELSIEFMRRDAVELDFVGQFDLVVCLWSSAFGETENEEEDIAVIRNVHRALRPGGWFVISTLNGARFYRKRRGSLDIATGTMLWKARDVHLQDEVRSIENRMRLYTPSELSLVLRLCGFRVISLYGAGVNDLSDRPVSYDDEEVCAFARALPIPAEMP
jgi:2-polyprenyl-3-methyl-5-hydroxy-6-metoxy-1,4-benzoquinol methylase